MRRRTNGDARVAPGDRREHQESRQGRQYSACDSCGMLFWPQHSWHTHCGECFRWRRTGELIAIAARLLRGGA